MSSSTTITEDTGEGLKVTGFIVLTILALAVGGAALYLGDAPFKTTYVSDWFDWARTQPTWSGVLALSVVVACIGVIGMLVRLTIGAFASMGRSARVAKAARRSGDTARDMDLGLSVPAAAPNTRDSLNFDSANGLTIPAAAVESVTATVEPPAVEIHSLEPAIFSDNASDSFLSRNQTPEAAPAKPAFDPNAALSETHGLQVAQTSAQIIPIRPEVQTETQPKVQAIEQVAQPAQVHDPIEAALLAETPHIETRATTPSDINAVITSAMRFIDPAEAAHPAAPAIEPVAAPIAAPAAEPAAAVSGFHAVAASMEPADDQAVIRQAVQMALSVWPDSTRAIASDELNVRVSYLYYDKNAQSARAFQQIASGDLSAAATTLQNHADSLAGSGATAQAAEIWRVIGALHMGRDDPRALTAYEKVSELDPTDANIHVYLARRYQMSNETGKLLPVLQRALAVIGDQATRLELLTPYADLKMKAGDVQAAGDAFEELGRLHETRAYLKPDDISARSAQGVSLARSAQAREMLGAFDKAGVLYKKAHSIFADLSAQMPEHAGLRSMADNARRDAERFNMA